MSEENQLNSITVITDSDIGGTLTVKDNKLNVLIDESENNALISSEQGLFVETVTLGSMQKEDKESYLTKSEIEEDYQLKQEIPIIPPIPTKMSELENDSGYAKVEDIPQDKFLNNQELIDNTLRLTLSDDSVVDINLQDLIPVTVQDGLTGDGTQSNPIGVNQLELSQLLASHIQNELNLGSIQTESKEDYVTEDDLNLTLVSLGGIQIGKIKG